MKTAKSAFLGGILLALPLIGAQADWRLGAETGAFYESNLSNSDRASDAQDDWAWRSTVRVTNGYQLSRDLRLTLGADLRGQVWSRFDAFNEVGAGLHAALRYRFGLGRQAPWIALEERIGYDGFQESGRSNWDESLALRGGIFISDRIALEAGYSFENLAASDDFFDQQSHSADARLIVDLTSSLQIALGYTYRNGDVFSYAIPPRPDIVALASELRPVTTFGSTPLYTAYRLQGQTHAVSLSAAYVLTRYISAQVTYRYSTTSHDPLRYENHSVEAKIAFAY
jgi:hypothetical protein